jgi:GntR family transcriptional regulator / MocR family aminotransferase
MTANLNFDDIALDRARPESLVAQLTHELRRLILSGTLTGGSRLPSTRFAADVLDVGRNTVTEAYETLISEGLCRSVTGAGTFVQSSPSVRHSPLKQTSGLSISSNTRELAKRAHLWRNPRTDLPLAPGVPALDLFPRDQWARALTKSARQLGNDILYETDALGFAPLREAIAAHVGLARGIDCTPDQVMILSSSRQGFDLATRLMTHTDDPVLVEDPGYVEARAIVEGLGRRPIGMADAQAMLDAMTSSKTPKLAIMTPTHHYPMGNRIPVPLQQSMVEAAERRGVLIVEDDYDGEFHHGKPSRAMASLSKSGTVFHVGTFSKSMFPGLRLAYAIAPQSFISTMVALRGLQDGQPSAVHQAGMAEFIRSGAFARHLRNMRSVYAQRRMELEQAIATYATGLLAPITTQSGLHLCCWLPDTVDDQVLVHQLANQNIGATALSEYHMQPNKARSGLVLGFANTSAKNYAGLIQKIVKQMTVAPRKS